jgi:preprotein translocase subunit SecD
MGLNQFPWWKNALIIFVVLLGFIYALPNLYGEDPAIQISGVGAVEVDQSLADRINSLLANENIEVKSVTVDSGRILYRFIDPNQQILAKEVIDKNLSNDYISALNLAPATPRWLTAIGAHPMKLGLDLRGGVHFLLQVDMQSAVSRRLNAYVDDIRKLLRDQQIHYSNVDVAPNGKLYVAAADAQARDQAFATIREHMPELAFEKQSDTSLVGGLSQIEEKTVLDNSIEQTLTTLRNRINELGVAESVVQRQGLNRIAVELPGIQDTARAKEILGKVATIEFRLASTEQSNGGLVGRIPAGYSAYKDREGRTVYLQKRIILTGDRIVGAQSDFDQYGRPSVSIRIRGDINGFNQVTRENVGNPMATVYIETRFEEREVNGEKVRVPIRKEEVISVATIQQALGSSFQINGLQNQEEARNLALLLRAGALPTDIDIIEERTIGPSLGAENIKMGMHSMIAGLALVLGFMLMYYRGCGLIADIGLVCNLILLVAVSSLVGVTLTLPAIAAMVLTLGMAVDANVLIYERIREELRAGASIQHSIYAGFEKAFATILDSNLTTMIAGVVLFTIGSGPIKGFAVTLIIGLLTSVFTAVTVSRAMVNAVYGGRSVKKISVGI